MLIPTLTLTIPAEIPFIGGKVFTEKMNPFSIPGLLGGLAEEALAKSGGTATGTLEVVQDSSGAYSLTEDADIDIKLPEIPEDMFTYKNAQSLTPWEGKALAIFAGVNTPMTLTGTAAFEVA